MNLNKEDLTPVWKILLGAAIEPLNSSPHSRTLNEMKEQSTAQLTSFVGQSSSENSGYDASSEDDFKKEKQRTAPNIPLILHPTLISFGFSVFDQFWENKNNLKPVKSLLAMLQFVIHLYNRLIIINYI